MATELRFSAEWAGERNAGINAGYESVVIRFEHEQPIDDETVEYWKDAIRDFYDGSYVKLTSTVGGA